MTQFAVLVADEVDRHIEERSLLKRPFCQSWQRGELHLDALWSILDGVHVIPEAAG